jgi:predicted DNA-binding protein (MmcQ/YjbR family)
MDKKDVVKYCLTKTNSYKDFPFGPESLAVKSGSEIFALISEKNGKICISLKCDPFVAQSLRQQFPSITPGYHINKPHWNTIILDGSVPEKEIFWMIDHSYDIAINKPQMPSLINLESL